MRNQKGLAPILIILLIAAATFGYLIYSGKINLNQGEVYCTEEAKICPDGSYVGRVGPKCEFSPCLKPSDKTADWKTYTGTKYSFKYPSNLFYADWQNGYPHFYTTQKEADEAANCFKNKLGTIETPCSYGIIYIYKLDPNSDARKDAERQIKSEEESTENTLLTKFIDSQGREWKILGPVYGLGGSEATSEVNVDNAKHWFDIHLWDAGINSNKIGETEVEQLEFIKKLLGTINFLDQKATNTEEYIELNDGRKLLIKRVGEGEYCEGRVGKAQTFVPKCQEGLKCQFREGTAQDAPGTCVKE